MKEPSEAAKKLADELTSVAYRQAVLMHESIEAGKGATGWKDEHLVTVFANHIQRALDAAAAEAVEREREALRERLEHGYDPELSAWLDARALAPKQAEQPVCPIHDVPTVDSKGRLNAHGLGVCATEQRPSIRHVNHRTGEVTTIDPPTREDVLGPQAEQPGHEFVPCGCKGYAVGLAICGDCAKCGLREHAHRRAEEKR